MELHQVIEYNIKNEAVMHTLYANIPNLKKGMVGMLQFKI